MIRREMKGCLTARRRGTTRGRSAAVLALLLATALGVPAAIPAVPPDSSGSDIDALRRADAPSTSSVGDQPIPPAPVVVVRPPEALPAAPERTLSANPLWEIPLVSLSATRERPIFSPLRRPAPSAVVSVPIAKAPPSPSKPPRPERPQLSLVGTIAGDEESFGIFIDPTTKAALRLKIGDDYEGWTLHAVQGREVTLKRDQQTAILTLPQPGTAAPGAGLPLGKDEESATARRQLELLQRDKRR